MQNSNLPRYFTFNLNVQYSFNFSGKYTVKINNAYFNVHPVMFQPFYLSVVHLTTLIAAQTT
jgi:hypothetical protein